MATRKKKQDKQYTQFSKRLITFTMIFWGIIRAFSVVAAWLNPDVGSTMTNIVRGIDDIAMVNVLAYTGNSVSEKIALGYFAMKSREKKEDSEEEEDGNDNESNG